MAKTKTGNKSRGSKIFSLVLILVFALIALAVTYVAANGNPLEIRSKAAEVVKLVKAWEFNGTTTEGWYAVRGTGISGLSVQGGYLTVRSSAATVKKIEVDGTNFKLDPGIKKIQLSARVTQAPTPVPKGAAVPTPVAKMAFALEIHYFQKILDKNGSAYLTEGKGSPIIIQGPADGQFHPYTADFKDTLTAQQIDQIVIWITPAAAFTTDIDYLRFVNTVVLPTPTPTPPDNCHYQNVECIKAPCNPILVCATPTPTKVCKTGVNSFAVTDPCTADYKTAKYVTFACYDGYNSRLGNGTCQSVDILSAQAKQICLARSNCPVTTPVPVTIAPTKPVPSPTKQPPPPPPPPVTAIPIPKSTPPVRAF